MMENRGKRFEGVVKESFQAVPRTSVDRLHDQTTGFAGSKNICDFIIYKKPFQYYVECKSVHGNLLSIYGTQKEKAYGDITNRQWDGLLEKSRIDGVLAGIMCWWVDKDVTRFIPIQCLQVCRNQGSKSVRYDADLPTIKDLEFGSLYEPFIVNGKKKRVFFDYDMKSFFTMGEHILRGDKYDL